MSTETIKATGQIKNGRCTVVLDFGHGTLTLDVEHASMADDEKNELLASVIEDAENAFADVLEALAATQEGS